MRGCSTLNPVSIPSFSAFAISASAAFIFLASSRKFLIFLFFSANFFAISWPGEIAKKLAPKIVSGRVENTFKKSFVPLILNFISAPKDLPIQFFCIVFTFSGQSKVSIESNSSSAYFVILINHWSISLISTLAPDLQPLPSITCSLARTVSSTGSQLTIDFFL